MDKPESRDEMLVEEFQRQFDGPPSHISIGPGRVNLIGEHTDYNDGYVLPIAIRRDIRFVVRARSDRQVRLFSLEYGDWCQFDLDNMRYDLKTLWVNYIQGVAWALEELGVQTHGFDGLISGNVPRASGLSSSAALEVAAAKTFLTLCDAPHVLDDVEIAKATQRAENHFVGVNCGIMDQFISVLGRQDHALLIDCRSLDYQLIPFSKQAAVVIGNTKASRSLAGSAYNERRAQCEEGVRLLQQWYPDIRALRDVRSDQLEEHQADLSPIVYRRCRHVVAENARVLQTVDALANDDLQSVGELMDASHASLRDDYEVSSPALDAMIDAMHSASGCYGARLTGAGFGGCAIALVRPGQEQAVADAIYAHYAKVTNIWPEVYTSQPGPGARVMTLT